MVYPEGMRNLYARIMSLYGGSPAAAARAFKTSRQAILHWRKRGVPKKRALEIERETKGRVTALEVLREGAR